VLKTSTILASAQSDRYVPAQVGRANDVGACWLQRALKVLKEVISASTPDHAWPCRPIETNVRVRYEQHTQGHTHQSVAASRASASAGAMPKRTATGAPAATRRLSSVVSTRKRSKQATVKSPRRAIT